MVHVSATLVACPDAAGPSREEDGRERHELFQGADEPTRFQTVERGADRGAAQARLGWAHVRAALAAAGGLLSAGPVIQPPGRAA